jgi:hypothetical protein
VPYQPTFALFDCPRSAGGLVTGARDETGQGKQDKATVGVKRHNVGCAGSVVGERR